MKILIKNGTIIDPSQGIDAKGDLLIEEGRIVKCGGGISEEGAEIIDAGGKIVAPGLIDMHTHLREPGKEEAETIKTGMRAAIAGGFTTVCAMPNTEPPCDGQGQAGFLLERAKEAALARLVPIGTITRERKGEYLSEMAELKEAGCPAVSDDGSSIMDAGVMRRALEYASMLDMVVISHCEDKTLAGDGVMHEGYWSTALGMKPIPSSSEYIMVERDLRLAEEAGARLHIAHISAKESVEAVRAAKKRGVKITAEATPHHFTLTDEALKNYDTNLKVNPPLRTEADREAVKKGLQDGTIDVIATDHAPHTVNEKEKEFDYAPFGMIGLETALSLGVMELLDKGILSWSGLISKMSAAPAGILGINGGTLREGAAADIVIIDPEEEWEYSEDKIRSRSKNSPFKGWKMKARVVQVLVGGKKLL